MKKLALIAFSMIFASAAADAQINMNRLNNAAKRAAERAVERKVEEKVEDAVYDENWQSWGIIAFRLPIQLPVNCSTAMVSAVFS